MSFRKVAKSKKSYETPVELFFDIRPRKIAALYDQQAQLLRDYAARAVNSPDVAIQGATGSGKTLVGLMIAEWRRRRTERPLYLCPTRQLVNQVANFAKDQLGLPAFPFVGPHSEFPPSERAAWRGGDLIAIATYRALFNINPFFRTPNFIVVDDAHAADQNIAEFWTVRVSKYDGQQKALFEELTGILGRILPSDEIIRLREEPRGLSDHLWVQIVPAPLVWEWESEISSILDQAPVQSDLSYRWSVLKGNLRSCQLYVSPYEIMFRPVLPPTGSYAPFVSASQRLYMSATLGRGGELERLSGRKSILRLPSPPGWDGHGVGRRFFIFPELSLDATETSDLCVSAI